jgi:pSer/pThr/pTyr-binding forkhead associated (FHA) protein
VNESVILIAGLSAAVILALFLIYRITGGNKEKISQPDSPPAEARPEPVQDMANVTRVLPVGMLIAKSGVNRGLVFPVDPSGAKIGRDKDKNQIVIDDPIVSREHAWIGLDDGKIVIRDENSRNGTYINSLESPRIVSQELRDGDVIYIGKKGSECFKYKTS